MTNRSYGLHHADEPPRSVAYGQVSSRIPTDRVAGSTCDDSSGGDSPASESPQQVAHLGRFVGLDVVSESAVRSARTAVIHKPHHGVRRVRVLVRVKDVGVARDAEPRVRLIDRLDLFDPAGEHVVPQSSQHQRAAFRVHRRPAYPSAAQALLPGRIRREHRRGDMHHQQTAFEASHEVAGTLIEWVRVPPSTGVEDQEVGRAQERIEAVKLVDDVDFHAILPKEPGYFGARFRERMPGVDVVSPAREHNGASHAGAAVEARSTSRGSTWR